MEWVETTGKTIAEALERALERLGVAEKDAEVVVLEEPKSTMFGLKKTEARLRVRVRPVQARSKRPSRRPSSSQDSGPRRAPRGRGGNEGRSTSSGHQTSRKAAGEERPEAARPPRASSSGGGSGDGPSRSATNGRRSRRGRGGRGAGAAAASQAAPDGSVVSPEGGRRRGGVDPKEEEMSTEARAAQAEDFVRGVVERFGMEASVRTVVEDDHILVTVEGDNVGYLIGPRGSTIEALQELTRTVVQRRSDEAGGRINVDVGGYRAKRAAALAQFAQQIAREVMETGDAQALEPMSAVDRKVVHDAVNELDGVVTSSEGDDPRRYVVIRRAERGSGQSADGLGTEATEAAEAGGQDESAAAADLGDGDGVAGDGDERPAE